MDGTILIADDDRTIRTVLSQAFTRAGCKVHATATLDTLMRWVEEGRGDLIVTDVMMPDGNGLDMIGRIAATRPGLPVIVISAQNTLTTAVRAEAARAADYLPKPFDLPDLLRRAGLALKSRPAPVEAPPPAPEDAMPLIGSSPAMREVFRQVARLLDGDDPILITGETGTGKTLLAHAIHAHAPRRGRPLLEIDPDDLSAPGRLIDLPERAQGGTVLVDGLGDVTPDGQGRLVRLIDRLAGGARFIMTLKTGQNDPNINALRDDLISRLSASTINLPPLRDRTSDIPVLVQHLATRSADGVQIDGLTDPTLLAQLQSRRWPGNVRQLEAAVRGLEERMTGNAPLLSSTSAGHGLATDADVVPSGHMSPDLRAASTAYIESVFDRRFNDPPILGWHNHFLGEVEGPLLELAMRYSGANQIRCAALLGINRNTLRKKLALHGIRVTRRRRMM